MKKFAVKKNHYLDRDIDGYYNCDYIGYRKDDNPDYLNHLKNPSRKYSELDLVEDYIIVYEKAMQDIKKIIAMNNDNYLICLIPRSKSEKKYHPSQLLFKKAISNIASNLNTCKGVDVIKRIKDTKTTHIWGNEDNDGVTPYKGITKDTCSVNKEMIVNRSIILVDDIYTENVNIAEDCIQMLFDFGAKSVILYVIAKTR